MPNSLLTIVTNVCGIVGVPAPSSAVTTTDSRARSMLGLLNKEVRELKRGKWWPVLSRFGTIVTVIGTDSYALPDDFDAMIPDTVYPETGARVRGADNSSQWAAGKSALSLMDYPSHRIVGNPSRFVFLPTPTLVETYEFEYKSKYPVLSADGATEKAVFDADDDYSILDDGLLELGLTWRYKHARGLDYAEDFREYAEKVEQAYAQALATGVVYMGSNRPFDEPLTEGYTRESNFGA